MKTTTIKLNEAKVTVSLIDTPNGKHYTNVVVLTNAGQEVTYKSLSVDEPLATEMYDTIVQGVETIGLFALVLWSKQRGMKITELLMN